MVSGAPIASPTWMITYSSASGTTMKIRTSRNTMNSGY